MPKTVTLYEVYPKRALQLNFETLPLMDRCPTRRKAIASARQWGAVVIRVQARILTRRPLTREVVAHEIIFVHKPRQRASEERDKITRKQLMGKLKANHKSLYRGYRR